MYLLDTDWIIQALSSFEPAASTRRTIAGQGINVSIVSIGEIYEGAFTFANPHAHLASFRRHLDAYTVLNLSEPIMERYAEIRAFLRRRGQMISDFDILIAATALIHDFTLLTFNRRHFERIPDLKLDQPT